MTVSKKREPHFTYDCVVLGGGFAGVAAARQLAKQAGRDARRRVCLVSDDNVMIFHPMLAEVAGSSLPPNHIVNPLRRLCPNATVLRARVVELQPDRSRIIISPWSNHRRLILGYEQCVIALGSIVDMSLVPGMAEHAYPFKTIGDALNLRTAIIDRLEEASLKPRTHPERRALLNFTVVGGGYSGVEIAGQINDFAREAVRAYKRLSPEEVAVRLVHSRETLMPEIDQSLGKYAAQKLRENGVRLVLGARVSAVTARRVFLNTGEEFDSACVVCTIGNAPHPVMRAMGERGVLPGERGRVKTDRTLRVEGRENIWAAGDCACVPLEDGLMAPPTAQFAQRQGKHVAKNIGRTLEGKQPEPFAFKGLGTMAPVGHRKAVGNVMGVKVSGFLAWWMWRTVYLAKLPGIERKVRVLLDWNLDLFFPRDISLLTHRETREGARSHFRAGDVIYKAGEPSLSFYVVSSGRIALKEGDRVVRTVSEGEYFGERELLEDRPRRFTAVAEEQGILVRLDAELFEGLFEGTSELQNVLKRTAARTMTAEEIEELLGRLPDDLRSRPVSDLVEGGFRHLSLEDTVRESMHFFRENPWPKVPVLDADGRVKGMVVRERLYDQLRRKKITLESKLTEAELAEARTIPADATVRELLRRLATEGGEALIFLDPESGEAKGVVSLLDLITWRDRQTERKED